MLQCATISQTSEFLVALFGPDPRNIKDPHLQMKPYGFRDAEKRPARHLSSLCHLYTLDAGDALVAKLFFHKISMSKHIPRKFQVLKYWENYWGNFQFKESYSPNSKVFNPNLGPHQAGLTWRNTSSHQAISPMTQRLGAAFHVSQLRRQVVRSYTSGPVVRDAKLAMDNVRFVLDCSMKWDLLAELNNLNMGYVMFHFVSLPGLFTGG